MGKMVYVRSKKTLPNQPGQWSEKKQLEVVTTYLATGSNAETSRLCNVPVATINTWKTTDWWSNLIKEIQGGEGQKQDNKMTKVIDKALDVLMDRIEGGDYQYDQKTGRIVKIPLKARDLERVASGLFDKRQLIRKQPTNIKVDALNQSDRLLALAEQFAKFAGQKIEEKVVNEYIEGEYEDALYEEQQEGLQSGTSVGTLPQEEPCEGSSTTECSEGSGG